MPGRLGSRPRERRLLWDNTNQWPDYYTYPGSTTWLAPASTPTIAYMYPGSPQGRCANVTEGAQRVSVRATATSCKSQVPDNYRDGRWDTASIGKLQYQKNFGSTAYVRLFGYTFYSNTNRATANGWGNNISLGVTNYQYEVDSHTGGLEMQFADQLSGQHLLEGMVSYITSNTLRYYNHNYFNDSAPSRSATSPTARSATRPIRALVIRSATSAPCNTLDHSRRFRRPVRTRFNAQDPCSDGELAVERCRPALPARRCC